jgi:anti-sigma regulatory factor (Ser/Thr protein kinase)
MALNDAVVERYAPRDRLPPSVRSMFPNASAAEGSAPAALDLRIVNRLGEIRSVTSGVDAFLTYYGIAVTTRRTVSMVLDELLANIVSHAYSDAADHWIDVRTTLDDQRLAITIEDDGTAHDPFSHPTPDTTLPLEARRRGGLGVHLVRSTMDEVAYARRSDRNVVTVVKRLSSTGKIS